MYAHFIAAPVTFRGGYLDGKTFRYHVIISDTVRPVGRTIGVATKKEAREIAAEYGAQPWNF